MTELPQRPLDPLVKLVAELSVQRAVLGYLTAAVGDMTGDRAAFIKRTLEACSEDIERAQFTRTADLEDAVRLYAQEVLAQILGRIPGSPTHLSE